MAGDRDVILFHYKGSPYARRIVWYLQLRGIPYKQCIQPPYLPRHDLSALNISYRRIPILSIGRDIYCDTRSILSALETLYPWPCNPTTQFKPLPSTPEAKALTSLLSKWIISGEIFWRLASLLPSSAPLLKDPKFQNDRAEFTGRSWSAENVDKMRPEALVVVRDAFDFLENTVFADGRDWVLGSGDGAHGVLGTVGSPTMADLEAVWAFVWIKGIPGAYEAGVIDRENYPRVWEWMGRWENLVAIADGYTGRVERLSGEVAKEAVLGGAFGGKELEVDGKDPLGLKKGVEVEVWPVESGFNHRDRGRLVGLSKEEMVIEKGLEGKKIRLHFPRIGFRVKEVNGARL